MTCLMVSDSLCEPQAWKMDTISIKEVKTADLDDIIFCETQKDFYLSFSFINCEYRLVYFCAPAINDDLQFHFIVNRVNQVAIGISKLIKANLENSTLICIQTDICIS